MACSFSQLKDCFSNTKEPARTLSPCLEPFLVDVLLHGIFVLSKSVLDVYTIYSHPKMNPGPEVAALSSFSSSCKHPFPQGCRSLPSIGWHFIMPASFSTSESKYWVDVSTWICTIFSGKKWLMVVVVYLNSRVSNRESENGRSKEKHEYKTPGKRDPIGYQCGGQSLKTMRKLLWNHIGKNGTVSQTWPVLHIVLLHTVPICLSFSGSHPSECCNPLI